MLNDFRLRTLKVFFCRAVLLVGFLQSSFVSAAKLKPTTEHIFKRVGPLVVQVKAALSADVAKASYGSGFVVSTDGLILTNFHVVSDAIHEADHYRIFIVYGRRSLQAEILGINVIQDLALLKVDQKFPSALALSSELPKQGEKVFSLGLPKDLNLSIVEGNYNGLLRYSRYEHLHLSSPINSGMSGGPTVNLRGEVIGVNVAIMVASQNISFLVPIRHAKTIIQESKNQKQTADHTEKTEKDFQDVVGEQLLSFQEQLTRDTFSKSRADTELAGWNVKRPPEFIKCWTTNLDDKLKRYQNIQQNCYLSHAAFLKETLYTGSYEVSYQAIVNRKLNEWQFFSLGNDVYNADLGFLSGFVQQIFQDQDDFTKFSCDEERLTNRNNIPMKVNYCLRAYVKFPKLLNGDIKAITLKKGYPLLAVRLRLHGFSMESIKEFAQKFIDTVRWAKP